MRLGRRICVPMLSSTDLLFSIRIPKFINVLPFMIYGLGIARPVRDFAAIDSEMLIRKKQRELKFQPSITLSLRIL